MSKQNLEKELEKLKQENEEYLNGWKRAKADFINYKKNESEIIKKEVEREKKKLFLDLLDILDSFNLAEKNITKEDLKNGNLVGLLKIKEQLEKLLKNNKITEIKTVGEDFDPNLHDAIVICEKEETESDKIIEEIKKGYLIDGQLLRPAQVKVTK